MEVDGWAINNRDPIGKYELKERICGTTEVKDSLKFR